MVNFMVEGERQKNKRLLKSFRELALRKKGEELLAVLPQGEDSGLDADMVDGMHAEQIIAETLERIGLPKKGQATFGGGGMTVHGNEMHAPDFEEFGLSLLLDGLRPMTDDLNMATHDIKDIGTAFFGSGASPPKITWNDAYSALTAMLGVSISDFLLDDLLVLGVIKPPLTTGSYTIRTGINASSYVLFQAFDTVMRNVMKLINGQVQIDNLDEITAGHGVDVDGVLHKDGEITLDGNRIMLGTNIRLKWVDNDYLAVMNDAETAYRSFKCYNMNLRAFVPDGVNEDVSWKNFLRTVTIAHSDHTDNSLILDRAGDITVLADKVLNFGDSPILYTPMKHICHFSMETGVTDITIETIPSGELSQDFHVDKIIVALDQAAGAGKSVTVEVSDGTDTMTVTISGDTDVKGSTTTNNFDLDVSAETLTLKYSQTAGGAATKATVLYVHHYITNV